MTNCWANCVTLICSLTASVTRTGICVGRSPHGRIALSYVPGNGAGGFAQIEAGARTQGLGTLLQLAATESTFHGCFWHWQRFNQLI